MSKPPSVRKAFLVSLAINLLLLGLLAYLFQSNNPVMASVTNSIGTVRRISAVTLRRELAERHGRDVLGDLLGRELVRLAADESDIKLDVEELEARWYLLSQEAETKAMLDSGETSELRLRDSLEVLVLLDQLSLNELNPGEREKVFQNVFAANKRKLEQIHVKHMLLDSEKAAKDVSARLEAGVDFEHLAARFSLDPLTRDTGGDLGWKFRGDFEPDISALLFMMPAGKVTRPVGMASGWHIFYVAEKRDTYEELRDVTRRRWCELRRPDTMAGLLERFKVGDIDKGELLRKVRPSLDPRPPAPTL